MRCLSLSALCLLVSSVQCYVPSDWTPCSKECGSGQRSAGTYTITCHNIGCDFTTGADCTKGHTDLVFVMDESGSIGETNYWVQKQFAVDIVDGLRRADVDAAFTTKVGLVAFGSSARTVFDLASLHRANEETTSQAIWGTSYASTGTSTWLGLDMAREMLTSQGRSDRKHVVIVLTDGASNSESQTTTAAQALKATGAIVYSIGVGTNLNVRELETIASAPSDDFYYHVDQYSGLVHIVDDVLTSINCRITPPTCTTPEPDTACSVTCGGGVRTVQKTCTRYDTEGVAGTPEQVTVTEECCSGACDYTPTEADCRNCPLQQGFGYLRDPTNCKCFFTCQWLGGNSYTLTPRQCCGTNTYWQPSLLTCGYIIEEGCSSGGAAPASDVCPAGGQEPSPGEPGTGGGGGGRGQYEPCVYQTNPEDPHQFMFNGAVIGTCPSGLLWDDHSYVCACAGTIEESPTAPCADYVLHYDFETTVDDVSCHRALSVNHGVELRAGEGLQDSKAAYFNGQSFLGVPYMNNHFAGPTVTSWTISLWYRRTEGSGLAGLLGNGDCEEDPSLALLINAQNQLEGRLMTSVTAYSQRYEEGQAENNQWTHVVLTYDGRVFTLYNNYGRQYHSIQVPATGGIANRQCNLKIGHKNGDATTGFFRGYMDEIRLYDRALTSSEVRNDYYTYYPPTGPWRRR